MIHRPLHPYDVDDRVPILTKPRHVVVALLVLILLCKFIQLIGWWK